MILLVLLALLAIIADPSAREATYCLIPRWRHAVPSKAGWHRPVVVPIPKRMGGGRNVGARNGRKLAGSSILASALVLTVFVVASTAGPAVAGGAGSRQFSLSTVSPVAQSTVAGNVVWEVAYTGATPDKITFYVDGALKWTEYAAPFRFNGDTGTLDTSTLSTGQHTLKAVGYRSGRTAHTTSTVSVSSSAPGQVPTSTASPAISGAALAGSALTASTGAWSGSPTSYAYKWQRCDNGGAGCQPIAGAASQEYLLVGDDVGRTVRVSVTATNGSGTSPPANSAATGVVRADLALGQPASTSSNESGSYSPGMANDGNSSTRWSSSFADNQWWQVDLGSQKQVDTVSLNWEAAYASSYRIQVSTDGWNFVDAATVSNSAAGWKTTTFAPVSAHYVRVLGITRATVYGFSFWDARVFGPGGSSTGDVPLNTSAPTVAGVVATDQTLTASAGSWTGAAPMSYAYRWLRCSSGTNLSDCSAITGATYSVYTVGVADVGAYLRVSVVASNSGGSASGVSAATAQVVSAPVYAGDIRSALGMAEGTLECGRQRRERRSELGCSDLNLGRARQHPLPERLHERLVGRLESGDRVGSEVQRHTDDVPGTARRPDPDPPRDAGVTGRRPPPGHVRPCA